MNTQPSERFPILAHLRGLQDDLQSLSRFRAFVLGLSWIGRQIQELRCAVDVVERRELLVGIEHLWQQMWKHLDREGVVQPGVIDEFYKILQHGTEMDGETVFNVIGSIENLLIVDAEPLQARVLRVAESSLNLIESYLYDALNLEVTDDNRQIVCTHQLIQQEMRRQSDELRRIQAAVQSELPQTVVAMQHEVRSQRLCGEVMC